jgi:hypothetical protein
LTHGLDPDFTNPLVHEGEVTLEKQLPGSMSVGASYVFSRGLRLPMFIDANLQPATSTRSFDILDTAGASRTLSYPFYNKRVDPTGGILNGYSDVNSWYNSLVLSARHPMRHGVEFLVNYTYSKATDGGMVPGSYGTFYGTDYPIDPMNRKLEWAASDLDQRHRFVASAVWMPSMKHISNPALRFALDGWAFSTIVTVSTGQPVTPMISGYPSGGVDGGLTGGLVNNAGSGTGGRAPWLARNSYNAPGYSNTDFRIGRQFSLNERIRLSLIGEAFNLWNHTNTSSVNSTAFNYTNAGTGACAGHTNGCLVPNAAFFAPTGSSNGLWGPRQLQLSGRLTF